MIVPVILLLVVVSACIAASIDDTVNDYDYYQFDQESVVPRSNDSSFPTAPRFGSIDYSLKENMGMMGPVPTDGEIRRACQALQNAGWDYWSMSQNWGSGTSTRSVMVAASLTMFASGSELVNYCNSK